MLSSRCVIWFSFLDVLARLKRARRARIQLGIQMRQLYTCVSELKRYIKLSWNNYFVPDSNFKFITNGHAITHLIECFEHPIFNLMKRNGVLQKVVFLI